MFEDWKTDSLNYLLDHETFLYNYHPEEENKVTVLQILKTSKYTIKLIDAIKYRKEMTDVRNVKRLVRMCSEKGGLWDALDDFLPTDYYVTAVVVDELLGGREKMDQLYRDVKEVIKFSMRSLRASLSGVLPVSLDDHILDNILANTDTEEFVKISEEEKLVLSTINRLLSHIYSKMRDDLFNPPAHAFGVSVVSELSPQLPDQLQEVVAWGRRVSSLWSEFLTEEKLIDNLY